MRLYLLLGSLFLATTATAGERIVERRLDVNPTVHLDLTSHRGTVEILTGTGATMEIFVRIEHDDEDVLEQVDIDIDRSPARVTIRSDYGNDGFSFNWFGFHDYGNDFVSPQIHYRIVVPEQASLHLTGHRSEFDVQAPAGRIEITAHRSNGTVTRVRDDLDLATHRGSFDIEVAELHDVNLSAHRGSIRMDVVAAEDFTLRGETHRGSIDLYGKDISQDRRRRNARVDHTEGSGTHQIRFNTHRGNMEVDFRDQRTF